MKIEIGKWYLNKTWKFLLPCLRGHGSIFVNKFNPIFKLAAGVHDTLLDGAEMSEGRNLLILCDKKHQEKNFYMFLNWLKLQPYYKGDYCPDADIKSRKHIIIIQIPTQFNNSYDCFLRGEYSKMYTGEQLDTLFTHPDRQNELEILKKDKKAATRFVEELKLEFDLDETEKINIDDVKKGEYALPLVRSEEIFNCCDDSRVYFNEDIDKNWLIEEEIDSIEEIVNNLKNNGI